MNGPGATMYRDPVQASGYNSYTYEPDNNPGDCQENRPGGYWVANPTFYHFIMRLGEDFDHCGGACCKPNITDCEADNDFGVRGDYSGISDTFTNNVDDVARCKDLGLIGHTGCSCPCYGKQEGERVFYERPPPPLPPLGRPPLGRPPLGSDSASIVWAGGYAAGSAPDCT